MQRKKNSARKRPPSGAIPIKASDNQDFLRYDVDEYRYDMATWQMYDRIPKHRLKNPNYVVSSRRQVAKASIPELKHFAMPLLPSIQPEYNAEEGNYLRMYIFYCTLLLLL
jgi:hypothetical protein